jgi:outer membrane protein assembly factor BamA
MMISWRFILLFLFLLFAVSPSGAQQVYLEVVTVGPTAKPPSTGQVEGMYPDTATIHAHLRQSLSSLYSDGYLAASYDSLDYSMDTVKAFLHPGPQYRWGSLKLVATNEAMAEVLPPPPRQSGNPVINLERFRAYQEQLLRYLENNGYPFASVQLSEVQETPGDTLHGALAVHTGKRYIIDSILIKGKEPVDKRFLYPYLGLSPGMVYNESRLSALSQKIENLSFLRQIRDFELEFSDSNRVNLFLYLERAEGHQAEGALGFLPAKDGSIRFTGQVDLHLVNMFRRGEALQANWSNPEQYTQELQLRVDLPYLLFNRFGLDGAFELYKQDTTYLNRKARVGFPLHLDGRSRIEVFADFEASSVISESSESAGLYGNFRSSLYGLRYLQDQLDYRLNPSRGWKLDLYASAGKRSGEPDEKAMTSAEIGLEGSWYIPLYRSWVLHAANETKYRRSWEEGEPVAVRENGLFRFGGFGSLRGFDDHALRASIYSVVSLEIKYLLSKNSHAYLFFDGAWYEKNTPLQQLNDWPYGFGLGGHIDSGMGIFYISYALGHQFDQSIRLGDARIHLGYVNKF